MSASIDNGPDTSEEDSREVLSTWLDDYIAGRCDRAEMHESFLQVCRSNPEAPWDALALLDQYQRRGRVDVGLARSLKAEIAQLVFGVATQTEDTRTPEEAALDTTGSRWRKLYEERGAASVNADKAVEEEPHAERTLHRDFDPVPRVVPAAAPQDFDPVTPALHRAFEPQTRPPAMSRPAAGEAESEKSTDGRQNAVVGIGTLLRDRYELMEIIGSGRAGTVYQAFDRHRSHLPSPSCYVAVRVLQLPRDQREAALAAIEREAYEAQSLSHPNIVSVFDLDRHNDVYFVVMELLEGELLSEVMQRQAGRPLSRERALAVLRAVGSALTHAHLRNLAHGDLKPASVLIASHGDVKVLDFGFARSHALDQWIGGEPSIDGMGANSTAAYASAERVTGADPHPRDDVYSFGCIAYELLSGRHPYGGRSAPLARAHGRAPQKISGLAHRQWLALQNALSWDRENRRVEVADLIGALGGGDAAAVMSPLPDPQKALDNPFGRGKGVLLAFLLIAIAGGVTWWQLPRFIEPASVNPASIPSGSDPERAASATPEPAAKAPPIGATTAQPVDQPKVAPLNLQSDATKKSSTLGSPIVAGTVDPPSTAASTESPKASEGSARKETARENDSKGATSPSSAGSGKAPSVEFDKDTYVATESDAMVKLTVRRNGSTRAPAKFRWSLRSNSAEAGTDFAAIGPGIEEVPAGSRTMTLTIPLVTDVLAENTELFLVELQQVEDGVPIGEQANAAVILVDDD